MSRLVRDPDLPQPDQLLRWMNEAGTVGVPTWECRYGGLGNPSQRAGELVASGHPLRARRERGPSGSWGTRYWLAIFAPEGAMPVSASARHDHGAPARGMSDRPAPRPVAAPAPPALFDDLPSSSSPYSERRAA